MNARPKSGRAGRPSFPIDDDWLAAVNAWIEREGRGAHANAMMVDEQIEAALKLARRLLSRRKPTT